MPPGDVRVVAIALDAPAVADTLDDEERRRAAAFVFDADRRRYIAAHAGFRGVVGEALGIPPRDVRWRAGHAGKPFVENDPELAVSLSHSGERALVAVTRGGRDVGVDIELIRPIEVDELARGNFSPAEVAAVAACAEPLAAFYRIWVAKEALLKARGDGLGGPLTDFDVSIESALLASRLGDGRDWAIRPVAVDVGYVAAVAADRLPWLVSVSVPDR